MTEHERVRIEAIGIIEDILSLPSDEYSIVQRANMIVDRILRIYGVEIKSDDQGLPKNPVGDFIPDIGKGQQWAYAKAQRDMLKPDLEGRKFVKVIPERDKNES